MVSGANVVVSHLIQRLSYVYRHIPFCHHAFQPAVRQPLSSSSYRLSQQETTENSRKKAPSLQGRNVQLQRHDCSYQSVNGYFSKRFQFIRAREVGRDVKQHQELAELALGVGQLLWYRWYSLKVSNLPRCASDVTLEILRLSAGRPMLEE
jgi:hypothetical protein